MTLAAATPANAEPVNLYAAGSLKTALTDLATACETATGHEVATVFGPSGTMRERIESDEPAHLFASAYMAHPRKREADGKGRAVLEGKALQLTGGPTSEQSPGHAIPTPESWPPATGMFS